MEFRMVVIFGLLATTVTGLAIPKAAPDAEAVAIPEPEHAPSPIDGIVTRAASDTDILKSSALGWYAHTTIVSGFPGLVSGRRIVSETAYNIDVKAAWLAGAEQ